MEFLKKLFGSGGSDSARAAKERLRIVLIHDRTDISPQLLDNLRVEMINVLTKYMEIDESKIEMDLDHDEQAVALVANIPVLRIKRGVSDFTGAEGAGKEREFQTQAEPSRGQNSHKGRRRR